MIGHDGNTVGQSAFLRILPEAGFAVVLLTTRQCARALPRAVRRAVRRVGRVAIPDDLTPPENPPSVSADEWLGTYERARCAPRCWSETGSSCCGPPAPDHWPSSGRPDQGVPNDGRQRRPFAAYMKDVDTYLPITFYRIPDGSRYVHYGVRANPMVTPA